VNRELLRIGTLALALIAFAPAAHALEYDEIFTLLERDVTERTLVQLVVDDGRGFELAEQDSLDLVQAGATRILIRAMREPAWGRAWLDEEPWALEEAEALVDPMLDAQYRTALDRGYGAGKTALVWSLGYYNGPLSRYYYDDPFFYDFWFTGYATSYWPSYFAYWYRPAHEECYAYPYDWYATTSYYCDAYYDPGYWVERGYTVQPGYGRLVTDTTPRWRDGGIEPPKGGRPGDVAYAPVIDEALAPKPMAVRHPEREPATGSLRSGVGLSSGTRPETAADRFARVLAEANTPPRTGTRTRVAAASDDGQRALREAGARATREAMGWRQAPATAVAADDPNRGVAPGAASPPAPPAAEPSKPAAPPPPPPPAEVKPQRPEPAPAPPADRGEGRDGKGDRGGSRGDSGEAAPERGRGGR